MEVNRGSLCYRLWRKSYVTADPPERTNLCSYFWRLGLVVIATAAVGMIFIPLLFIGWTMTRVVLALLLVNYPVAWPFKEWFGLPGTPQEEESMPKPFSWQVRMVGWGFYLAGFLVPGYMTNPTAMNHFLGTTATGMAWVVGVLLVTSATISIFLFVYFVLPDLVWSSRLARDMRSLFSARFRAWKERHCPIVTFSD